MDHIDKLKNEHEDFLKGSLSDKVLNDPQILFDQWYKRAHESACKSPHSVVLTTASIEGKPSSRIVYMRDLSKTGITIYTNYKSRKGKEIVENPNVSLLFYWEELERQVRIEGEIRKIDPNISDKYFASRPRISKIGAWASEQSESIENRVFLEDRVAFYEEKFPNKVPRPPHWGGLIIEPDYYEFWQGRKGRLHDRICFEKENSTWCNYRIAP